MLKTYLRYSIVIGFILMLAAHTWADFQSGEDAYVHGDYETALEEWGPLAAQGDASAQNMLGYMYRYGQGTLQDYAEARQWYRRAADQGNPTAQNNLGMMHRLGLGGAQNYQEAMRWFRRAAEQGNGAGQNHLGLMYYKGEGVPQDLIQAFMWATLATEQGLDQAIQALAILRKEMTPAQIEEAQQLAARWKPKGEEVIL
ncbi:MAG: sel1 repeat family protein [Nitrospirales bacterium]|nr:sel1 repeat family protein [Nitrospirales bacterium]